MTKRTFKREKTRKSAVLKSLLITSIYAFIGFAWVIGSDIVLSLMHDESSDFFRFSIIKGLCYVAVTAILIYFLLYKSLRKILQESETRERNEAALNEAQRFAHIGSFEYNINENRLTASNEALHILEIENDAQFQDLPTCFELIHPEDRARVEKDILEALSSRQSSSFFFRLSTASGTVRNVHVRLIPRSDDEEMLIILGTIQDITDRILAETAAKDNETIF